MLFVLSLPSAAQVIRFRDVAPEAGLDFVLENHPTARKHLVETMAGGLTVCPPSDPQALPSQTPKRPSFVSQVCLISAESWTL